MSESLTLYTNPQSRGRIARWMLEEVGASYETVVLDYGPQGMKGAGYLAINPMGKVPAIRHGDRVVTEAAAICLYLADAFPQAGLAPAMAERADYYRWVLFAAGPMEAALSNHRMGWDPAPERQRMFGYGSFDHVVETLDHALAGRDYVAGSRFSAADVYVGSAVGWGLMFGTLPPRPAFEAYAARLMDRPGFQRAKAKDDALVPAQQALA